MTTATSTDPPTDRPNIILVTCLAGGAFVQALDLTIANVALPYMQGGLSAGRDQITWVVTSYVVASAVMTTPIGWLAARLGRKKLFLGALLGFTIASALCGTARSLEEMVLYRILQGAIGAALAPLSQAMMFDLYPTEQRGHAGAIWGSGILLGPILGPTLGGLLTDALDWRWVFYINVPVGIAIAIGVILLYHEHHRAEAPRFDWMGFGLLALALGALQLMLDRGTTEDWWQSREIQIEAALAILGFYLFIVHSMTSDNPFLPLRLFGDANFVAGLIAMFVIGMFLLTTMTLFPPYLQTLSGYSVTQTGLALSPRGLTTLLALQFVGRYCQNLDARVAMLVATAFMALSFWRMALWTPDVDMAEIIFVSVLQGIGTAFFFGPINLKAFATLPIADRTTGSSLLALARNIGGGIGISISASYLAFSIQRAHEHLAANVTPFNRALQHGAASFMWNPAVPFSLEALNRTVEREALIIAYSDAFMLLLLSSILATIAICLVREPKGTPVKETAQLPVLD